MKNKACLYQDCEYCHDLVCVYPCGCIIEPLTVDLLEVQP